MYIIVVEREPEVIVGMAETHDEAQAEFEQVTREYAHRQVWLAKVLRQS